jgi:hypothetical protein
MRSLNSYSRFLDVDKVDLILRRRGKAGVDYREVQVKYGKLYRCGIKWEQSLFDVTSWRFFKAEEFSEFRNRRDFFLAYVLAEDIGYRGDIFVFPIEHFCDLLQVAIPSKNQRKVYFSRLKDNPNKWIMRTKPGAISELNASNCLDVSKYRRNFGALKEIERAN